MMQRRSQTNQQGSVLVDQDVMKSLRHTVGLTQSEAADRAGYSERVLRKIEAGQPIKRQTLDDFLQVYRETASENLEIDPSDVLVTSPKADLEELVREWFRRAFNERDLSVIDDIAHPDVVLNSEGVSRRGRAVIKERISSVLEGFNPIRVTIDDVFVINDYTMTYWSVTKTHVGEFLGIAPTGKIVEVKGSSMARFHKRKIVEVRDHWDVQDLVQKLTGSPSRPV